MGVTGAPQCVGLGASAIVSPGLRQNGTTGKSPKVCPALSAKIFPLQRRANQTSNSARLAATRGAIAIVTNVRWDAMDVRLRLTSVASAYGEIVWVRRPDAGVKSAEAKAEADDGVTKSRVTRTISYKP